MIAHISSHLFPGPLLWMIFINRPPFQANRIALVYLVRMDEAGVVEQSNSSSSVKRKLLHKVRRCESTLVQIDNQVNMQNYNVSVIPLCLSLRCISLLFSSSYIPHHPLHPHSSGRALPLVLSYYNGDYGRDWI